MFKYSEDELIASKQREEANILLSSISRKISMQFSSTLDKEFAEQITSFDYLVDVAQLAADCNDKFCVPCITISSTYSFAMSDIDIALNKLEIKKRQIKKFTFPFIEFSFKEMAAKKNPHGFGNVYMIFISKHKSFQASEEMVMRYLTKFKKLKAFT